MKILQLRPTLIDIGRLDHTLLMSTKPRQIRGMRTICDACGRPVTDDHFVAGFKKGFKNFILHQNCAQE